MSKLPIGFVATLVATLVVLPAAAAGPHHHGFGAGAQAGIQAGVQNAPLTAEFNITQVRTLANGATLTRQGHELVARDAQGRTLRSVTFTSPGAAGRQRTITRVENPADGTTTVWSSERKVAVTFKTGGLKGAGFARGHGRWNRGGDGVGSDAAEAVSTTEPRMHGNRPAPVAEDLGASTIEGQQAQGTRKTWTTPAGEIGNDKPLVRTMESWSIPSLGLVANRTVDDPRMGKSTRQLASLKLGEPDAALFAPPAGYTATTRERPMRGHGRWSETANQ